MKTTTTAKNNKKAEAKIKEVKARFKDFLSLSDYNMKYWGLDEAIITSKKGNRIIVSFDVLVAFHVSNYDIERLSEFMGFEYYNIDVSFVNKTMKLKAQINY